LLSIILESPSWSRSSKGYWLLDWTGCAGLEKDKTRLSMIMIEKKRRLIVSSPVENFETLACDGIG
jgi:hypothetical protein